ncbi:MAG: ABC transporter ATP-binding protein [Chthoniobacterales bacterium]|jgi:spermidine/putrescine transport system ATP-binding protein|nr:ABC transporter ATP-binding protein [Chthoniobacterales bacterium]
MVEIRDVTKRFGDFVALDRVSLEIKEGEFMTFLGPSGCGKTTCLRLISGFEQPTTGQVLIAGRDVTNDPPYKRDVNQVFQSYALFPHLTVRENIEFGLRMKKMPPAKIKEQVDWHITITSLQGMEDRKPAQLSGGQRQRVALARAIVCQPKVLLLDEPLSALDAKLRTQMRMELKNLQKSLGITFIFVTHDQEEALSMSDRIAVMNKGRVEQIGTAAEIYHHPRTEFVAGFIGETNIVEAEVLENRDGKLLCRLEGGVDLWIKGDGAAPGAKMLVSVRPEKIHLHRSPPRDTENVFQGRVTSEVFKGAVDDMTVVTEGGLALEALLANEGADAPEFHEGEQVWCSVHPQDVSLLTREN